MEIDSPPYPKNNSSPSDLFNSLVELYQWVATQFEWVNTEAARLGAPSAPFIKSLGVEPLPNKNSINRFTRLAVPDMFMSWQALRRIREKHDSIIRNYENAEDWNSDGCIFHRISLVRSAITLLSISFLDFERREAKGMDAARKTRKEFFKYTKGAFYELNGGEEDEEVDFDAFPAEEA